VQLNDPNPMVQEAKREDATDAISWQVEDGRRRIRQKRRAEGVRAGPPQAYALPLWSGGITDAEKMGAVGTAGTYGLRAGTMLSNEMGRAMLSDANLAMPLKRVPYATLESFSFHKPESKTDLFALRFSLKDDDLPDLAHSRGVISKMTRSTSP
jgi:hypothetical protein